MKSHIALGVARLSRQELYERIPQTSPQAYEVNDGNRAGILVS